MGNIKDISYFRENIYSYRDRINSTCLVAFHHLIDRIEKDIILNGKESVLEKRGLVEIGIKSSLDRAILSNEEHNEYSKNCSYKDFTAMAEIIYRYYLRYAFQRLKESGFNVDILKYSINSDGRRGDNANICNSISDDYYSSLVDISITYSGNLEKSLLDGMRDKYNLDDIEANPVITDEEIPNNIKEDKMPSNIKENSLDTLDEDDEKLDVLSTTTPSIDCDIEDAKEIYRRKLVGYSNSVLKSILDLIMNCISSGKESIDIDTGIVKGELSKIGADISDKGLYDIMCWLSTILSETYNYRLDIADSFQKDKVYIMNVSGWA